MWGLELQQVNWLGRGGGMVRHNFNYNNQDESHIMWPTYRQRGVRPEKETLRQDFQQN